MTKFLGEDIIIGNLPSNWTLYPIHYHTATPGSQWAARILRICRFDQFRIGYEYREVKQGEWAELEIWWTDLDRIIKSGKIWKRYLNEKPRMIP